MAKPAQVLHPGVFVAEEMSARGWTVDDLANAADLTPVGIRELLALRISVTPIFAMCLAKAFGTSKEFWMNLQKQYYDARRAPGPRNPPRHPTDKERG